MESKHKYWTLEVLRSNEIILIPFQKHHVVIVINQNLEFFENIGHIFHGKIWTIRVALPLTNFDG
jgi:hypothetical protein